MARSLFAAAGITHPETKRVKALARQISRWEAGRVGPRDWAGAIADLFGITPKELFPPDRQESPRAAPEYPKPIDDLGQVSELLRRVFLKRGIALTALPAVRESHGVSRRPGTRNPGR
ncbi:hypothetical protein [Actinomadura sp. KC06]|uniref:hypothetical protein n=1 Tax=Actinomadura sp. KC06 TaxID=2530369 RepID=UPI0014053B8B|nr:hypothetical protein [Actinomadura sp. KC06]